MAERFKPLGMDTSARPRCLPNTRLEHIQYISEWVTSMSDDNVLWISGVAGAGKSTLINTIADIYNDVRRLGAYIYFTDGPALHGQPVHAIKTIAFRLAEFDSRLGVAIAEAAASGGDHKLNEPLTAQFEALIADPINAMTALADEGPIVIAVDAIDECGSAVDRKDLLRVLSESTSSLPRCFRFIVTSRPEPDIEASFSSSKTVRKHELDVGAEASKLDVEIYIRNRMKVLQVEHQLDWLVEDRVQKLIVKADGLFIWASTVCNFLEQFPTIEGFDQFLALTSSTSLDKMNHLYATALGAGPWHIPQFELPCRSVLGVIFASRMPLSCAAIDTLLRPAQPSATVTKWFKPVLRWSEKKPIRPLHASFTDYITNSERCKAEPWFVDIPVQNSILADLCINHLDVALKENMLGLILAPQGARPWKDTGSALPEATAYACIHWISHVSTVLDNDARHAAILRNVDVFLSKHLLHWVEAMSLLCQSRSCAVLLGQLSQWIPVSYLLASFSSL